MLSVAVSRLALSSPHGRSVLWMVLTPSGVPFGRRNVRWRARPSSSARAHPAFRWRESPPSFVLAVPGERWSDPPSAGVRNPHRSAVAFPSIATPAPSPARTSQPIWQSPIVWTGQPTHHPGTPLTRRPARTAQTMPSCIWIVWPVTAPSYSRPPPHHPSVLVPARRPVVSSMYCKDSVLTFGSSVQRATRPMSPPLGPAPPLPGLPMPAVRPGRPIRTASLLSSP